LKYYRYSACLATAVQQRQLRTKWLLCSTKLCVGELIKTCDFFLRGFVKEDVYVRRPPITLVDLKNPYHNCGELSDARHRSSGMG
jgi:hypothetical protein